MNKDQQNSEYRQDNALTDVHIPDYELFSQLSPLTKYLIKRALREGLFDEQQ